MTSVRKYRYYTDLIYEYREKQIIFLQHYLANSPPFRWNIQVDFLENTWWANTPEPKNACEPLVPDVVTQLHLSRLPNELSLNESILDICNTVLSPNKELFVI